MEQRFKKRAKERTVEKGKIRKNENENERKLNTSEPKTEMKRREKNSIDNGGRNIKLVKRNVNNHRRHL